MSSLVVFPFRSEEMNILGKNIREALMHPAVERVLCIGYEKNACYKELSKYSMSLERLKVTTQERIGAKRPGKGDGMNTGLRYFLEKTDFDRLHFYDADIQSFSEKWITKAEQAADNGFQAVRHYFPPASTGNMISWMITKTGFALLWPDSNLPKIKQPLAGELLLTREAAKELYAEQKVLEQSDWGIDTLYTWMSFKKGFSLYESYQPEGKIHNIRDALTDKKTMLTECFAVIQSLQDEPIIPEIVNYEREEAQSVPEPLKQETAYDLETSLKLLMEDWTRRQVMLLELFPDYIRKPMLECQKRPRYNFMDESRWYETFRILMEHFVPQDEDWQALLFKLWVARILNYTARTALRGYDYAMEYLEDMIELYRIFSTKKQLNQQIPLEKKSVSEVEKDE